MKLKALIFGLLIAGSTVASYVTIDNNEDTTPETAEKQIPKNIKIPTRG